MAEALIYGEDDIHDGCMSDMKHAEGKAKKIGKMFSFENERLNFFIRVSLTSCLDNKTTVEKELKKGYKQATELLSENSEMVVLLADALMKFKTLGKCIFFFDWKFFRKYNYNWVLTEFILR